MIDPAEALLAVVGVRAIISRAVENVWKRDLTAAADLEATIAKQARALCRGELSTVPRGRLDYKATLRDLAKPYEPAQVQKMVARVPGELQASFVALAQRTFEALRQKLPTSTVVTLSGIDNVLPDDMAVHKFVIELDAIDDPLRVFGWMGSAALTRRQVGAIRDTYPSLSQVIDAALEDAILAEKTAKKSWELPPHAEMGVGKWLGRSRIGTGLARKIQANYAAARKTPKPPAPENKPDAVSKEALSPAQVANFAGQTR